MLEFVFAYLIVILVFWLMFRRALRTRTWQDQVRLLLMWPWILGEAMARRFRGR